MAYAFAQGLLQSGRQDIDEVSQYVPNADYYQLQHFISDSPWDARALMDQVSLQTNEQMSGNVRLIVIDEVAIVKKGTESVGVSRQWCGARGKVDNCQVGVAAYLTDLQQGNQVDMRLYLPNNWIDDKNRLKKAGLPMDVAYKSKLDIAREIVEHQAAIGVSFDWITADSFYGRDLSLAQAFDGLGKYFVMEVPSSRKIFLTQPTWEVPVSRNKRGRKPVKPKPSVESVGLIQYLQQLGSKDFKKVRVRNTFKGKLITQIHTRIVWLLDEDTQQPVKVKLVIRKDGNKIKFIITNAFDQPDKTIVKVQAWRYFIERNFQEAKNVVGMKYYQVRKYSAWQHYMALIMLLLLFLMAERQRLIHIHPLFSYRDIKFLHQSLLPQKVSTFHARLDMIDLNLLAKERDYCRFYGNLSK